MKIDNLSMIDNLLNTLELGLRTYFVFARKAVYKDRQYNRYVHGFVSETPLPRGSQYPQMFQKPFRLTTAAVFVGRECHLYFEYQKQALLDVECLILCVDDGKGIYRVRIFDSKATSGNNWTN